MCITLLFKYDDKGLYKLIIYLVALKSVCGLDLTKNMILKMLNIVIILSFAFFRRSASSECGMYDLFVFGSIKLVSYPVAMHRGWKCPFNTFSKNIFFKKSFYTLKLARELKF